MAVVVTEHNGLKNVINLDSIVNIDYNSYVSENSEGEEVFNGHIAFNYSNEKIASTLARYEVVEGETREKVEERYETDLEIIKKAMASRSESVIDIRPPKPEPPEEETGDEETGGEEAAE